MKAANDNWPTFKRASDLAGTVFPVSERCILEQARRLGIGRKFGRCIVFSVDDVLKLYEALPCPSNSSNVTVRPTGTCAAPSAASALMKAQALLTRKRP